MKGKTVCKDHGGKSLAGLASPSYKHGRTSKYLAHLPATMAPHFDPDDERLLELRNELALVEAGIAKGPYPSGFCPDCHKWYPGITRAQAIARGHISADKTVSRP